MIRWLILNKECLRPISGELGLQTGFTRAHFGHLLVSQLLVTTVKSIVWISQSESRGLDRLSRTKKELFSLHQKTLTMTRF